MPEPLHKNSGGYRGETINVAQVLREIEQAAAAKNWERVNHQDLLAFRRQPAAPRINLYLSSGIHGDEPAGPLAALQLLQEDRWPTDAAIWFCPCLNPTGLALSRRENADGIDLNRDYREPETTEIRAHVGWLKEQPQFDISVCLHEDWESHGFYVYETNPNNLPTLAEKIIEAVAPVCPIEDALLIDDWEAAGGIIRPRINPADRPKWAEALYLIMNNSKLGYTMESPSDFPMAVRVMALVTAVRAVLDSI